jgi:hypothetical protein
LDRGELDLRGRSRLKLIEAFDLLQTIVVVTTLDQRSILKENGQCEVAWRQAIAQVLKADPLSFRFFADAIVAVFISKTVEQIEISQ